MEDAVKLWEDAGDNHMIAADEASHSGSAVPSWERHQARGEGLKCYARAAELRAAIAMEKERE